MTKWEHRPKQNVFEVFLTENNDKYLKVRSRAINSPQKQYEVIILISFIFTLTPKSESNISLF